MHQHTKVDEEIVIELLPHGLWNASFIPREHLPVNQKFDPTIIVRGVDVDARCPVLLYQSAIIYHKCVYITYIYTLHRPTARIPAPNEYKSRNVCKPSTGATTQSALRTAPATWDSPFPASGLKHDALLSLKPVREPLTLGHGADELTVTRL